ncbi:lasso RiPP family leader peptide-containing protein [Streptomyces sp. NPDC058220]
MDAEQPVYEAPMLVEVGDFTELTRITANGGYYDNPFWDQYWF